MKTNLRLSTAFALLGIATGAQALYPTTEDKRDIVINSSQSSTTQSFGASQQQAKIVEIKLNAGFTAAQNSSCPRELKATANYIMNQSSKPAITIGLSDNMNWPNIFTQTKLINGKHTATIQRTWQVGDPNKSGPQSITVVTTGYPGVANNSQKSQRKTLTFQCATTPKDVRRPQGR